VETHTATRKFCESKNRIDRHVNQTEAHAFYKRLQSQILSRWILSGFCRSPNNSEQVLEHQCRGFTGAIPSVSFPLLEQVI